MMKHHRFFISPNVIQGERIFLDDAEIFNQLKKVLRAGADSQVLFLDGSGKEYKTIIKQLSNSAIEGEVIEVAENQNELESKITLYQAICKKDKFEWILQKGTELGMTNFAPMITNRTEKLGLNRERAKKILKEAAEQSERGIVPSLGNIQNFEDSLKSAQGEKILLDRPGDDIKNYPPTANRYTLSLFIGPEGGWTEKELDLAKNSGAKIISIGKTVLRTETAGIIAAGILLNK